MDEPPLAPAWRPLRTVAAIVAGGTGRRIGGDRPKQLLTLAGRSILEHAVAAFEDAAEVDDIVVLMAPGHVDEVRDALAAAGFTKVRAVAEGGATRDATSRRALELLGPDPCNVLIHDAARPLVTGRIIRACVEALCHHAAVLVAVAAADTVVVVDDAGLVTAVPERARLRRAQTPQAFRSPVIRAAYRLAGADPHFTATDDCSVVRAYLPDVPVVVVEGADDNIKITVPADLAVAEALLRRRSPPG
jgi:2-C-methyl-D-erythritol 4-phosphate cytidylyltransferase